MCRGQIQYCAADNPKAEDTVARLIPKPLLTSWLALSVLQGWTSHEGEPDSRLDPIADRTYRVMFLDGICFGNRYDVMTHTRSSKRTGCNCTGSCWDHLLARLFWAVNIGSDHMQYLSAAFRSILSAHCAGSLPLVEQLQDLSATRRSRCILAQMSVCNG